MAAATAVGLAGARMLAARRQPVSAELAVERRLECPQCTGIRLDVCDRPICDDMRADIRRRLAVGQSPDQIVKAYSNVYGTKVLAEPEYAALGQEPWLPLGLLGAAMLTAGFALRTRARSRPGHQPHQ